MKRRLKVFFIFFCSVCILVLLGTFCYLQEPRLNGKSPEIEERDYFQRCVMENIITRQSHAGVLPPNISKVEGIPGKEIYRSGMLKPEFIPMLAQMGIKSVLTLNTFTDKTDEMIRDAGMSHISYDYYADTITADNIRLVIAEIINSHGPVLIHCYGGADRTSIVIAALKASYGETDMSSLYDEMYRHCHVPFEKYIYYKKILEQFLQEQSDYNVGLQPWGDWMLSPAGK